MSDAQTHHSRLGELAGELGLHEHLCVIYDTQEEQFAAALPYLSVGLERGEKCLYLADENTAADVLEALRKGGTDIDSHLRKRSLGIISKNDVYLKTGRFDPDSAVGFWTEAATQAKADGFPGLRILAEMTWTLGESGAPAGLLEFESQISHMYRDHDAAGICQYNRAHFSPEVILGVIRTHPLVVYGGLVSKNPYYVPPDEFLKPNQPALEVERLLKNILEKEQASQTLRRSEERWRSVFENSAIGVELTDLHGRFLAANRVYQKLVGYTQDELRARSFLDITHEDFREANRALITELVEGKRQQFQIEKKYRRKDGTLIWVSNNVSLLPGSATVPRFLMALSEDITERKLAEEALRQNEQRYRDFVSHSSDGVWRMELGLLQLLKQGTVNIALARLLGDKVPQVAHFSLTDAVNAAKALLDPVRVPGEVIVDHQMGALQVDPLPCRVRGNENLHFRVMFEGLLGFHAILAAHTAMDDNHGLLAPEQRRDAGFEVTQRIAMLREDNKLLVR